MKDRLLKTYLPLLLITVSFIILLKFSVLRGKDLIFSLSISSGYAALIFVCLGLVLGTVYLVKDKRQSVSSYFRRDIGIWSGIVTLFHVYFGLQVHLRGGMYLYFLTEKMHLRNDIFGYANYIGLLCVIIIILLLFISNDYSIKKLGINNWKNLQRLNYFGMLFLIGHSMLFQKIENRVLSIKIIFYVLISTVAIFQLFGIFLFRKLKNK